MNYTRPNSDKRAMVRESILNIVVFALLTFPSNEFDLVSLRYIGVRKRSTKMSDFLPGPGSFDINSKNLSQNLTISPNSLYRKRSRPPWCRHWSIQNDAFDKAAKSASPSSPYTWGPPGPLNSSGEENCSFGFSLCPYLAKFWVRFAEMWHNSKPPIFAQ